MNKLFEHIDKIQSVPVEVVNKKFLPLVKGGGYCLLNGRGGLGKSMLSMRSMVHFLVEHPKSNAIAVFTEDDRDEVNKRLYTVCRNEFRMGEDKIKDIKARARFKTVDNQTPLKFVEKIQGVISTSPSLYEFAEYIISNNVGFVILDPLKAFHSLDENSNSEMDTLVRSGFQYLGATTSAVILVLHHSTKGANGARGAATIEDSSRISYSMSRIMKKGIGGIAEPDEEYNGTIRISVGKDTKGIFRDCTCVDGHGHMEVFPRPLMDEYKNVSGHLTSVKPAVYETSYQVEETPLNTNPTLTLSHTKAKDDFGATSGFKTIQIALDELLDFISDTDIHYSPVTWVDGYRKGENYKSGEDCIVFDIDDGMSLHQAKQIFSDYMGLIVTTKSHQKDKNGIVCDRFRVILPYKNKMNLDADLVRETKILIYKSFSADEQVANLACKFRGSPMDAEFFYLKGTQSFEWESYYKKARIARDKKNAENEARRIQGTDFSDLDDEKKIKALTTKFNTVYTDGNRNNAVADIVLFGKSMDMDSNSIVTVVDGLVRASGNPIGDKELNTVFKYHLGHAV